MSNCVLLYLCLSAIFRSVNADKHNNHLYTLVPEFEGIIKSSNTSNTNNTINNDNHSERKLPRSRSLHFYALGDVPYLERERQSLPQQMDSLSLEADFAMHVGDLKKRSSSCLQQHYTSFRNIMAQSLVPIFNTIGDNDVAECTDSLEAYATWLSTFDGFDDHAWPHKPFVVTRQIVRPENFAFTHNDVFVISLHVIHASFQEDPMLYSVVEDTLEWLLSHQDEMQQAKAVVVFGHTFPVHPKYVSIKTALAAIVTNLSDTPFLYIQGDKHMFSVDNPIPEADNLLRVVVDKGGIVS